MAKILLVDDNEDTLYIIGHILKDNSHEVIECKDGIEAFEKARIDKPDLVLLDVLMPKMCGFETCIKLKTDKQTKDIPVIFQSATVPVIPDEIKGLGITEKDYFTFPINFGELLVRIDEKLMEVSKLRNDKRNIMDITP